MAAMVGGGKWNKKKKKKKDSLKPGKVESRLWGEANIVFPFVSSLAAGNRKGGN